MRKYNSAQKDNMAYTSKMTKQIVRHKIKKYLRLRRFETVFIDKHKLSKQYNAMKTDKDLYIEKDSQGLLVFNKQYRTLTLYLFSK